MHPKAFALTLLPALTPGLALAGDLEIFFGNNSWDALSAIEFSPAGAESFSPIPLPGDRLGAGDFIPYSIADGDAVCTFDLRFTKEDGSTALRPGVDLCAATYYHYADE